MVFFEIFEGELVMSDVEVVVEFVDKVVSFFFLEKKDESFLVKFIFEVLGIY